MKKNSIRNIYRIYKKYFFSEKIINYLSYQIFKKLIKIPIWNNQYYHIFLPIKKFKEINTFIIINFLISIDKYIILPISNFRNYSMNSCLLKKNDSLIKNHWGILEPFNKSFIHSDFIDIIFIPLLVFDILGYRIGYGKGFYDRFIFLCKNNAMIKIGLSFFQPIPIIKHNHEHDLCLDIGITPDKIIFFNQSIKKKFKNIPYHYSYHNNSNN